MEDHKIFGLVKRMTKNLEIKQTDFQVDEKIRIKLFVNDKSVELISIHVLSEGIIEMFRIHLKTKVCSLCVMIQRKSLTGKVYYLNGDYPETERFYDEKKINDRDSVISKQLEKISEWLESESLQRVNIETGEVLEFVNC